MGGRVDGRPHRADLGRFSKGGSLEVDFQQRFGTALDEEALNHAHQVIIVAAELDPASERIVGYLNERDIAINVVFFQVFQHGDRQLLSRVWLIDPGETQANAASAPGSAGDKEPWNGEFHVSFGDATSRSWDDARPTATSAPAAAAGTARR